MPDRYSRDWSATICRGRDPGGCNAAEHIAFCVISDEVDPRKALLMAYGAWPLATPPHGRSKGHARPAIRSR